MLSKIIEFKHLCGRIYASTIVNIYWVCFKLFKKTPYIYSDVDTIKKIINENLSVARYGDGEFRLMTKRGCIGFQDSNIDLSNKLISSFATRNPNLLICCYNFKKRRPMNNPSGLWLKKFTYDYFKYFDFFDSKYKYGDTDISRFYYPDFYRKTDFAFLSKSYIPLLKQIWENKNLLIVEGFQTKLGVGNDLFGNAKQIRRILCPTKNAFNLYDKILKSVIKNRKNNELVLIALGPTASVLATELCTKYQIRSIDIGHVDVVYLWYLNKSRNKDDIVGKYVNEKRANSNTINIVYNKDVYDNQVVEEIIYNE